MRREGRKVTCFKTKESIDRLFKAFKVGKVPGGVDDVIGKLAIQAV
jgi:hypothetical protein